jgi:membrane-bound metal-dependent hydrolase YbcI (DUF457 family)
MDLLIHSAAGAFIGWALPQRMVGSGSTPLVVAGALLPDVDSLIDPFLDPRSGFAHRGFTHSLFGISVLAPLVALVALRFSKEKRFTHVVALIFIGMLSHLLLDLPTPMGTMLFYPFSSRSVHLDFLGYVDWTLFILGLFVPLAVWTYANRNVAVRRGILSVVLLSSLSWWLFSEWPTQALYFAATVEEATEEPFRTAYPLVLGGTLLVLFVAFARKGWAFRQSRAVFGRIGVAAFSIYLLFCMTVQGMVLSKTSQFTRERGIVVWRRAASRMGYSSLVGPFRWTGLVLAPEGVYEAKIVPFRARNPMFTLFPSTTENPCVAKTRSISEVQWFLSRARFPVTRYRVEKGRAIVEYQEYGLSWKPLLRIEFNERKEVLAVGWIEH